MESCKYQADSVCVSTNDACSVHFNFGTHSRACRQSGSGTRGRRGHGAAPRWRGTAGGVQGEPGHHLQLLIAGTRPGSAPGAAGQTGSGTKGGSGRAAARWPTPANRIPCRSAGGYRELTRCCRACRQSGSGTRERRGHGQRLDGPGRPAVSRAKLASPCRY